MAEMIEVVCPTCGTVSSVDPAAGAVATCGMCRSRFAVTAQAGPPSISLRAAPAAGGARRTLGEADLPAPALRRQGEGLSVPGARSLAPAEEGPQETDLPAPKRAAAVASLDLDDLLGPGPTEAPPLELGAPRLEPVRRDSAVGVDLPAPKRSSPEARPSAELLAGARDAPVDLPAPVRSAGAPGSAPARPSPLGGVDLPAPSRPAAPAGGADLPAPRLRPGAAALDHRAAGQAARGPAGPAGVVDLPTPRGPAGVVDLPTPRGPAGVVDLPTPRGPAGVVDLPTPRGPAGVVDLPTPRTVGSATPPPRPAPPPIPSHAKAGPTDLPIPRTPHPELPVPKGFFDDLPQPSAGGTDVAPKGFFDDLPRPSEAAGSSLAPKGFFDDAPGRPTSAADAARAKTPSAPGSLFDDIPVPSSAEPLDLGLRTRPAPSSNPPLLDLGPASSIDLGLPPPSRPSSASLPPPITPTPPPPAPPISGLALETEPVEAPAMVTDRPPPGPALAKASHKKSEATPPVVAAHDRRRRRILLLAVLGVTLLAGGGAFGYQRYAAAQARKQALADNLATARRAVTTAAAGHWQRASSAAKQALALDEHNIEALGLAAEASFAAALDEGTDAATRIRAGKMLLAKAAAEAISAAPIQRARALAALANGKPEQAQNLLTELLARPGGAQDPNLLLYAGWAKLAAGSSDAVAALDRALAAPGAHKLAALYARGQSRLAAGELDAARADFAAVLELDANHLGAQVALAASLPSAQARQRENDALAILQRKDLAKGDPRAIAHAWLLVADEARRSGRLDLAAERYRKGLEVRPEDLALSLGVAQVELAKGRLATARETVDKVLAVAAQNLTAILVAAELDLAQRQLDAARKRLEQVREAKPTHPLHLAQLALLSGRLLEDADDSTGALALYRESIAAAGERDLAPTMAAVSLLTRLADQSSDPEQAQAHRAEVEALLLPLTQRAREDSSVAVTLGAAYLAANNATKAEEWLTTAVTQRPDDLDARFQLAKAVRKLGRIQDAISLLEKAYAEAPARGELGAELAATYEDGGRIKDASELYEKLLAAPGASLGLRAHAGRFLARMGHIEQAAKQGAEILALAPDGDAAGYFLRGLGALHAKQLDDARRDLQRAVNLDRDPEYLDALGQACEQLGAQSGDSRLKEEALRAYGDAVQLRPLVSSLLGLGRLYLERREPPKAIESLLQANQLDPRNREVLYLVGVAYQELRQFKAAATWLGKANELGSEAETDYRLGLAYIELESASAAAASLTRATASALAAERRGEPKVSWLTEALYQLGRIESDRRNDGAARRAWETYLARSPASSPQAAEVRRMLLGLRGQ